MTSDELNLTRAEKWHYVIDTLLGGLTDDGVLVWLTSHRRLGYVDLDELVAAAARQRDGMVAS